MIDKSQFGISKRIKIWFWGLKIFETDPNNLERMDYFVVNLPEALNCYNQKDKLELIKKINDLADKDINYMEIPVL